MNNRKSMQLKSKIKNIANKKNIRPQLVMQVYMLERLLKRISVSKYKDNFILKGGFLISSMLGLQTRTTKDLDTTLKGLKLTDKSITEVFHDICMIDCNDNIHFELNTIEEIRIQDNYPGLRAKFIAIFETLKVSLYVDITTGDRITPKEIEFEIPSMFEDEVLNVQAYNIETLLAEKLETILSRVTANTRLRDFYDVFILVKLRKNTINLETLKSALTKTAQKRDTMKFVENYQKILIEIFLDERMCAFWERYRKEFHYAEGITFAEVKDTLTDLLNALNK